MSRQPPPIAQRAKELGRDPWVRAGLGLWVLACIPYFLDLLTTDHLRIYSEFWVDIVLLPTVVLAVLWGVRSLGSSAERTFWYLIAAALGAMWLTALGFWTPRGQLPVYLLMDCLFLTFYLLLALAALLAPHREKRESLQDAWPGILGVALSLLALLAYWVLIPSALDAERYTTWLPSMYLFQILDLLLVVFFIRLFRDAKTSRWRTIYGLMTAAVVTWTLLDLTETLNWARIIPTPTANVFDLIWTLPLAIILVAARAGRLPFEKEAIEPSGRRARAPQPAVRHIALLGTILFPLIHFGLRLSGLVDEKLNPAREVVVVGAIIALGATAIVERALAVRSRTRDRRRREKAEAALRESETRYRTLVENAPEAIVILDVESGRFVDSNQRALELFQVDRQELLGLGPGDLSPTEQPDGTISAHAARRHLERASTGDPQSFHWVHQDANGKPIHCEVNLVAMPAEGTTLIRGSMIEVTDRLALRDQLRQSRRMEAVGRLAGGVAHDFNNLLTVISGYSDLALDSPELDSNLQQMIMEIRSAGSRAARLIRQLLAFSRRQEMAPQALSLNDVLSGLEPLLRRLLGEDLTLDIQVDLELSEIYADPAQVEQVIVNLAVNGRDSMPDGGFLYVETKAVELATSLHHGPTIVPTGSYGRLTLRDTGVGMDEATMRRAFEPFFTTKGLGVGTGLGLATVYGIVAQSGGYITVDSAPKQGSTFGVYFPLAPSDSVQSPVRIDPERATPTLRGQEHILFVEDEESVRSLQCTGLRALGYNVLSARDAEQALDLLAQNTDPIKVLVTDVVLPGLSGPELAERILASHPHVRVIFVSGYTDDLIRRKGPLAKETRFIQKPYSPVDLAHQIREAVAESSVDA